MLHIFHDASHHACIRFNASAIFEHTNKALRALHMCRVAMHHCTSPPCSITSMMRHVTCAFDSMQAQSLSAQKRQSAVSTVKSYTQSVWQSSCVALRGDDTSSTNSHTRMHQPPQDAMLTQTASHTRPHSLQAALAMGGGGAGVHVAPAFKQGWLWKRAQVGSPHSIACLLDTMILIVNP